MEQIRTVSGTPACIFCDNAKDIINYKGKNICPDCIRAMNEKL